MRDEILRAGGFVELGPSLPQAVGAALHSVGRHDQAIVAWQQALALYEALHIPEADKIRARLAPLAREADRAPAGVPPRLRM